MSEPTLANRLAVRQYPKDLSPLMEQKWRNLLFLHWEYDPEEIQKTLPKGLYVDCFQGKAYVGLTPFFMKGVKLKLFAAIPAVSDFMEMNLRTYVYDEAGVPGVWFYSLDANSVLAVQMASNFFFLPYFYADMESHMTPNQEIAYRCQRQHSSYSAEFTYKAEGDQILAEPDSLEFFLIERYILFASKSNGELMLGRIHHAPYHISKALVPKWDDKVFEWDGLKRPKRPPEHICFAPGVDVEIFSLQSAKKHA